MKRFSRVLAAVDFSKPARGAFEYALALRTHHGAELVVVHAVPQNQAFSWHARERLALTAKLRRRADRANLEFKDKVQQGDPAKIILSHARSLHPDVIVLGTHQRSGIDRVANGSVAERVAAKSSVPVLVVPYRRSTVAVEPVSHLAVAVDFSASSNRAIEQALTLLGDTATEIGRVVDSIGADLLVVGVPQRNVISRAVFGTTATRLLRMSRIPMLAVPEVRTATAHDESDSLQLAA